MLNINKSLKWNYDDRMCSVHMRLKKKHAHISQEVQRKHTD